MVIYMEDAKMEKEEVINLPNGYKQILKYYRLVDKKELEIKASERGMSFEDHVERYNYELIDGKYYINNYASDATHVMVHTFDSDGNLINSEMKIYEDGLYAFKKWWDSLDHDRFDY